MIGRNNIIQFNCVFGAHQVIFSIPLVITHPHNFRDFFENTYLTRLGAGGVTSCGSSQQACKGESGNRWGGVKVRDEFRSRPRLFLAWEQIREPGRVRRSGRERDLQVDRKGWE